MIALNGACHCGAVRVAFEPAGEPDDLAVRACQCGFCRRHGARTVSDPGGFLNIRAAPGSLQRYRFGRKVVDALLCDACGVYIASSLVIDGALKATLNVAGVHLERLAGRAAEPVSYEGESDHERLARRRARWTPTELVETTPSA